jgi:glutamate formiminotransferase/glutamate formiminotransferase/formiminotetrahydrofolate cyclodeaminase
MPGPLLLSVPNVSEGGDRDTIEAIGAAFAPAALLDIHSDPDHGRSVFTLAAPQGVLADALVNGAQEVVARIDVSAHPGIHPHVGAIDVAPVVYLDDERRGPAVAEALTAAALIGDELELPVFLYGQLATTEANRERAAIRRGGPQALSERIESGELVPDFGPKRIHPTAGALLVTARPPLIAFNLDLDTEDLELAKRIAARLRESSGGLTGVRAIGLHLPARGRAQVSFNVHDHRAVPLRILVEEVRAEAPIAEAELVGLAPAAAFEGFPDDVPLREFDPSRHLIENAVRSLH